MSEFNRAHFVDLFGNFEDEAESVHIIISDRNDVYYGGSFISENEDKVQSVEQITKFMDKCCMEDLQDWRAFSERYFNDAMNDLEGNGLFKCLAHDRVLYLKFTVKYLESAEAKKLKICTVKNVTGYYKKNLELIENLNQARTANESKRRFIANMSHDLRTPLNGVCGAIDLAMMEDNLSEALTEYLEIAKKSSIKLTRIIDEIIDYASLDETNEPVSIQSFKLSDLLDHVVKEVTYKDTTPTNGIQLSIDSNMPEEIKTDPRLLGKIVFLLLEHAYKFSDRECINVYVGRKFETSRNMTLQLRISVPTLTIETSAAMNVFGKEELDEMDIDHFEDLGIYLNFARVLTKRLGGRIGVDSTKESGASYIVDLPVERAVQADNEQVTGVKALSSPERKETILVIDGDHSLYVQIYQMLPEGYRLKCVRTGLEALHKISTEIPKVIIFGSGVIDINKEVIIREAKLMNESVKIIGTYEANNFEKPTVFDAVVPYPLDLRTFQAVVIEALGEDWRES